MSTNDRTQQAKLPLESPQFIPSEFHFSPNEEWVFALWKGGMFSDRKYFFIAKRSGDRNSTVVNPSADAVGRGREAPCYSSKLGGGRPDPQMSFGCWSMDSSRLLVRLEGEVDKLAPPFGYVYVNTRTRGFELTNHLRKINKAQTAALVCAEPVDPLPTESQLKARFDRLERDLNTTYTAVLAKADNSQLIPDAQRTWIKHRDEGAKIYMSIFPQAKRESRRLQFMADVTAVRLAMSPNDWQYQP